MVSERKQCKYGSEEIYPCIHQSTYPEGGKREVRKMKTNKWLTMLAVIIIPCLITQHAWAGSEQRYRWEGVAIGLGAALVGSALADAYWGYGQPAYAGGYCGSTSRYVPPPVNVYPQTHIIYHTRDIYRTRETGRTDRYCRHRPKPWKCDRRHRKHRPWR